jgi:hypothetical protein
MGSYGQGGRGQMGLIMASLKLDMNISVPFLTGGGKNFRRNYSPAMPTSAVPQPKQLTHTRPYT